MALAFVGCSGGSRSGSGAGSMLANHRPPEDVSVIAYRSGPGGFPIPADAVNAGMNAFVVPRPHHVTVRMQRETLLELGFTIESVEVSGTFYMLRGWRGDQAFTASIGSRTRDSSEIVVGIGTLR